MKPPVIGLTGLRCSGKSTVAQILGEWCGYERIRFADPLKAMLRAAGLSDEEVEGSRKEMPCDLLCGRSPRHAMQTLGTEWGRNLIHRDLWISLWRRRVDGALARGRCVVVEDLRFENEERLVRALGGTVWRVDRPGSTPDQHVSEAFMYLIRPDATIRNGGTLDDLRAAVARHAFGDPLEALAGPMGRVA
jgi:hypothetical protein